MTEETNVERVEATVVAGNALMQIERAQIDAQIATAQMYPKHQPKMLSQVKANMLTFATMDEETAAGCFYTLPRAGKTIQGASVRMAEIGVSCYGNIRVSVRVVEVVTDGPNPHVMVQAVAHDLEQNVAASIEKRRRITAKWDKKTGEKKPIDEDDINLAVNACGAIGYRDAAFKVIPQALIKPVWEAAKRVAIGDVKSLGMTRQKCIERLTQMGAPLDRILAVVKCANVEAIGQPELEILFGLGTALKDGDCTIEQAFPAPEPEQKQGVDALADRLDKNKKEEPKPTEPPAETKKPPKTRTKKQEPPQQEETTAPAPEKEPDPPAGQEKPSAPPKAKYKCGRCERLIVELKGGKCPYCFGDCTTLAE